MEISYFHELKKHASSFLTAKIRSARLALTDVTPVQILTEEATDGSPTPASAMTMSVISQAAFDVGEFVGILDILRRRLSSFDRAHWREAYKALAIIDHLLVHGPKSAAREFQDDKQFIRRMASLQHVDEKGFNWGLTVRRKAERVLELLEMGSLLSDERERARRTSRGIEGFGSFGTIRAGSPAADGVTCYARGNSLYEVHIAGSQDVEVDHDHPFDARPGAGESMLLLC